MVLKMKGPMRNQPGLLANSHTSTVTILGAIFVSDVQHARVFLAMLIVLYKLQGVSQEQQRRDAGSGS